MRARRVAKAQHQITLLSLKANMSDLNIPTMDVMAGLTTLQGKSSR